MTGKSTPSSDESLAGRLERLVNNEQFADVAFRVGEPGEVIFGHKAILSEASEVFRGQFAGMFKESRENVREHEIPIVDIEPGTFKELMRYMYCERVNVTARNVVDILYGSNKYLLTKLNQICENFMQQNLTDDNVLEVFDSNRRYELEGIDRFCLDVICDNPIKIFANESFLTLAPQSVHLIASRKSINCQTDQLLGAIDHWLQVNEDETENGTRIVAMVREQKGRDVICKKMHNFAAGHYLTSYGFLQAVSSAQQPLQHSIFNPPALASSFVLSTAPAPTSTNCSSTQKMFILKVNSDKPFSIYGVGISIKSKHFDQSVKVNISVERTSNNIIKSSIATNRTVTAKEDICVEEFLFQKQSIDVGETCMIYVDMQHGITPLFCLKNFEPEHPEIGLRFTCSGQTGTNSCVAYVLYNFQPSGGERKKLVVTKDKRKV